MIVPVIALSLCTLYIVWYHFWNRTINPDKVDLSVLIRATQQGSVAFTEAAEKMREVTRVIKIVDLTLVKDPPDPLCVIEEIAEANRDVLERLA